MNLPAGFLVWLSLPEAQFLDGKFVFVNWDVEEMEAHKGEILGGLLKIKWVPVLPCSGGSGW